MTPALDAPIATGTCRSRRPSKRLRRALAGPSVGVSLWRGEERDRRRAAAVRVPRRWMSAATSAESGRFLPGGGDARRTGARKPECYRAVVLRHLWRGDELLRPKRGTSVFAASDCRWPAAFNGKPLRSAALTAMSIIICAGRWSPRRIWWQDILLMKQNNP
ncbi:hypothetical protein LNP74_21040 [Klebsiella pneumoniae subsp. pneumoniae]|nr:hypothetical protein [Klebsiella pneumoniae subsp. pneumoniae]